MSLPALFPPGVTKEIRALLPTWLGSAGAVIAAALISDRSVVAIDALGYVGMLALGAQSIGHEYTYRTLAGVLSLPLDRRRLLLRKVIVLAAMLTPLSALAWIVLFNNPQFVRPRLDQEVLVVAVLSAFFLAPWLTMICRSSLAGIVFSIAVPAVILIAGDLIGLARYGSGGGALIDNFKFSFFWRALFLVCAVAAVSGWRMFARLEAIEGAGADIQAPKWLSGDASAGTTMPLRRHHPYWLLARKELRLQQMTFAVVIIFTVGWTALTVLASLTRQLPLIPLDAIAVLYFAILTVLIGSLASAEERQMGTLEWQTLLPIASWKQWMVKIGIVFGLVSVLGIVLPAILIGMFGRVPPMLQLGGTIFFVTTISLYISSLSTSGVKAMVLTLPAIVSVFTCIHLITMTASRMRVGRGIGVARAPLFAPFPMEFIVWPALVSGFIAVALRFAYLNHRSPERSARRVLVQTGTLTAYLLVGLVVVIALF